MRGGRNTPARLGIFTAGLLIAFAAAWGVGDALSPVLDEPAVPHELSEDKSHDD